MAEVKIDLSDIERWTKDIGGKADQIPFVMSQLLNDGAFKTRQVLVNMWPNKVTVRNANFISAALQINKSDKHNLTVEIYDRIGHGHLKAHDVGGTKQVAGGKIAIPNQSRIRIGARGVPPSQRPKAIIARTPKRALRITSRGIFVGQHGRLNLVYNFANSSKHQSRCPVQRDVRVCDAFKHSHRICRCHAQGDGDQARTVIGG